MLVALIQVLFAAIRVVARSSVNIVLYSVFSRVFHQWFGLNSFISFVCSAYCLSKVVNYFKRIWRNARLQNKKNDEKLVVNELTFESASTSSSKKQFENDWTFLLDDESRTLFPLIVDVPFANPWLFFGTMMFVDYQTNNWNLSYSYALFRTLGCLIVLICGSSIRYQTLVERERKALLEVLSKPDQSIERFLVYSKENSLPVASICVKRAETIDSPVLFVQLFNLNSKFDDYSYDVEHFLCQKLIAKVNNFVKNEKKTARILWSIPSCRRDWATALKANKFFQRYSYADFAFMPLVKSHVEQYEFVSFYDDKIKSE